MSSAFLSALKRQNFAPPPVWLMRQAGRYHAHYQALRRQHSFLTLCQNPDLAAEVALGPMREFDFDAAILFSDILFPLAVLGPDLDFSPGPILSYHLQAPHDLKRYKVPPAPEKLLAFQAEALHKTRALLPPDKALIGFVGGPLTLYTFAVHGSHKVDLSSARAGLEDGRFAGFMEILLPLLLENMALQADARPDALAIFESCAGDYSLEAFQNLYLPHLKALLRDFAARYPDLPIIYYGKNIGAAHWRLLRGLGIRVLGIDHHQDLPAAFSEFGDEFVLQGNIDPNILTLPEAEAEGRLNQFFASMQKIPQAQRQAWICGLGHGVTPQAKEANVRRLVQLARQRLA